MSELRFPDITLRDHEWQLELRPPTPTEARVQQIRESTEFGSTFRDESGETRSFAAFAPVALEAHEQLELDLPGYSERAMTRMRLEKKLDRDVLPLCGAKWVHNYIERLRGARRTGLWGFNLTRGKPIVYWDTKAGLSRLCPDDAREEAMRLSRRTLPALQELQGSGHSLYYAVLTTPNVGPGELAREMKRIFTRFRKLLKAKDGDGQLLFPEIKGALGVLEAPLGRSRDWNVHLNVIFVVSGYFDWAKLRQWWHWDLEIKKLPRGERAIGAALRELIKYAVAATVAKSAHKAAEEVNSGAEDASSAFAPPMLEWTGHELLEWLRAMRGFRRTRAYGALYGLKAPEPEEVGQIVWLGAVGFSGGRYHHSCALLDSIPEDKSTSTDPRKRWQALMRSLAPGGIAGAGTLGDFIPRDALHEIEF